jgi:hypothetical protein
MSPNLVQASGQVADKVVSTLGAQPQMLLVVLLNVAMIAGAGVFLLKQEEYRHSERAEIIRLINTCILETVPPRAQAPYLTPPPYSTQRSEERP